ncbi:MAG: hypothetical protein LBJ25_03205 [Candidatus Margulisbacteria bacterium]|jgi:hypothetical protein|nr:hypothetical protein [Candidatus Margulisiibacteriota bacterium]
MRNFSVFAAIKRDLKTNYRDKMAAKYYFSSQTVAWSGLNILNNSAILAIRFCKPTKIRLNENEFFEVTNIGFCGDTISYMVTPERKMHHVNDGRVYTTTEMGEK